MACSIVQICRGKKIEMVCTYGTVNSTYGTVNSTYGTVRYSADSPVDDR
jgi:hypothetical protein